MNHPAFRVTKAIGITASLIGAAASNAGAASVDAAPGFFFSTLPFDDTGTTIGATDDISSIPASVSTYPVVNGPDVFYSFRVVAAGTMTFVLTPTGGNGYDPAIYLLAGGATGGDARIGRDAVYFNEQESFTTTTLEEGIYFFVVDSYYSTGSATQPNRMHGAYSLNITGTAQLGIIPEPGTAALGLTALGVAGWRRRRLGAR